MAVVDDAAPRRDFDGALLLVRRAGDEVAVIEDLKLNQAERDQTKPKNKERSEEVQPLFSVAGWDAHRHRFTLDEAAAGTRAQPPEKIFTRTAAKAAGLASPHRYG